jgi:hypothetical protein
MPEGTGRMVVVAMKASTFTLPANLARLKLAVRGAVQGLGFRPFVYRLNVRSVSGCSA